ncbi:MAG: hypothetical protein FWC43_04735 [Planctomycetaceae bacterium]|nr:hypothetical protein [Planctomycetaceae bacterium]
MKKQIIFKNGANEELIFARELTFAEYEEYFAIVRSRDENNFDRQTIAIMSRFAEDANGGRRFPDGIDFNAVPVKSILPTAYAFGYALAELNTITQDDTNAMLKN